MLEVIRGHQYLGDIKPGSEGECPVASGAAPARALTPHPSEPQPPGRPKKSVTGYPCHSI